MQHRNSGAAMSARVAPAFAFRLRAGSILVAKGDAMVITLTFAVSLAAVSLALAVVTISLKV